MSSPLSLTLASSSSPLEPTDNANVSFVTYKGDYYVSTETTVMHKVDPETLETTKKVIRWHVVAVILALQATVLVIMAWSATEIKIIRVSTKFLHLCLEPAIGGLEQIHCRERSNRTPPHWSWWNILQHGEFLHFKGYFRSTTSLCPHCGHLYTKRQLNRTTSLFQMCLMALSKKLLGHYCFCADRSILQHHPSATDQDNSWGYTGGNHSAVLYSCGGQDQTILLPQLWWTNFFPLKSKYSLPWPFSR